MAPHTQLIAHARARTIGWCCAALSSDSGNCVGGGRDGSWRAHAAAKRAAPRKPSAHHSGKRTILHARCDPSTSRLRRSHHPAPLSASARRVLVTRCKTTAFTRESKLPTAEPRVTPRVRNSRGFADCRIVNREPAARRTMRVE